MLDKTVILRMAVLPQIVILLGCADSSGDSDLPPTMRSSFVSYDVSNTKSRPGLFPGPVYSVERDGRDRYWFKSEAGLSRWDGSTWANFDKINGFSLIRTRTAIDRLGNIYRYDSQPDRLSVASGKAIVHYPFDDLLKELRDRYWDGDEFIDQDLSTALLYRGSASDVLFINTFAVVELKPDGGFGTMIAPERKGFVLSTSFHDDEAGHFLFLAQNRNEALILDYSAQQSTFKTIEVEVTGERADGYRTPVFRDASGRIWAGAYENEILVYDGLTWVKHGLDSPLTAIALRTTPAG